MAASNSRVGVNFQFGIPGRNPPQGLRSIGIQAAGPGLLPLLNRGGRGAVRGGRGGRWSPPPPPPVHVHVQAVHVEENDPICPICDRPKVHVNCLACGWEKDGVRVRMICPSHPRQRYLQDLECCPNCRMENLEEEEA